MAGEHTGVCTCPACCPDKWAANAAAASLVNLFGQHPERGKLCHAGHEAIIHFGDKCPMCADSTETVSAEVAE